MMKHASQYWWLQKHILPELYVLWLLFDPCYSLPTFLFLDDLFLTIDLVVTFTSSLIISTSKTLESISLNLWGWNFPRPCFLKYREFILYWPPLVSWLYYYYIGFLIFVFLPFCSPGSDRGVLFYLYYLVRELIYFKSLD